jgi:excisionase family DNA binding protein
MTDEPMLDPKDIAAFTGLEYHAVVRRLKSGEIRGYKLAGKWRVRPQDLEAWLEANLHQPVAPAQPRAPRRSSRPPAEGSLASLRAIERGAA